MNVNKEACKIKSCGAVAQQHEAERMCVACKKRARKRDLIRFVRTRQGEVILDKSSKMPGRGAYVCLHESCFLKLCGKRLLNRALGADLSSADYERLGEDFIQACRGS